MSEHLGTESDTTYPINSSLKYPFNRFDHCLKTKDIFSFYDLTPVRVIEGATIRNVLGGSSHSSRLMIAQRIFVEGLGLIAYGVVNRDFIFRLPFKNMEVTFKIIRIKPDRSKALFKFHRGKIDPFEVGFQMAQPVLNVKYKNRPNLNMKVCLSKPLYKTMMENITMNRSYENSKIKDIEHVAKILQDRYTTLTLMAIKSILRHGLNTIFKGIIKRCDTYINLDRIDKGFFMYFCGSKNNIQYSKIRRKIRFLMNNKKNKPEHDGKYYFFLSDSKKLLYEQGEDVKIDCTRYIEELHAGKRYASHIYYMYLPEEKKKGFFTEINNRMENIQYYEQYIDNEFKLI